MVFHFVWDVIKLLTNILGIANKLLGLFGWFGRLD